LISALGQPVHARVELSRVASRLPTLAVVFAALCVSVLSTRVADAWFVQLMLDQAASRAADQVQLGLLDNVSPADFTPPHTSERLEDLAGRLDPVLGRLRDGTTGILRVNLVARDGTILYSDLTALRGHMVPLADKTELKTALNGSVGADEEHLDGSENADLRPRYGAALEVYVPVRLAGEVVGAYEIYEELGPVAVVRAVLWGALVGLWCLFAVGIYLIRRRRAIGDPQEAPISEPRVSAPRANAERDPHVRLTRRELQVLRLMATSHTNRDIAETLVVSEETVRTHVKRILRKLDQPDRTQAVVVAVREGLIELPNDDPQNGFHRLNHDPQDGFHPIG
jgi:DNA-binding CsgD family transcriptional regulator